MTWPPEIGIEPYYSDDATVIWNADCLQIMASLPDSSADLIVTDPPYFRVKAEWWDRQWDTAEGFLTWLDTLFEEWWRILKPNGSLYVFASPKMAARVEVAVGEWFNVLNRVRWVKSEGWHKKNNKEGLRSYLSPWEEIVFAEHKNSDNVAKGEAGYGAKCDELRGFVFEPIRAWFLGSWGRSGLSRRQVDAACGCSNVTQYWFLERNYQIPTADRYAVLQQLAPGAFGRDYEDLRADYEDLRADYEDLRRPFSVTPDVPYTDVWDFPTVQGYPGKHPCEKPHSLMRHIIRASSRPGAVVADFFSGSGVTAEVSKQEGRRVIAVDIEAKWCERTANRLK